MTKVAGALEVGEAAGAAPVQGTREAGRGEQLGGGGGSGREKGQKATRGWSIKGLQAHSLFLLVHGTHGGVIEPALDGVLQVVKDDGGDHLLDANLASLRGGAM